MKIIETFEPPEAVLGVKEIDGTLYVATTRGVFRLEGDKLVALKFVWVEDDGKA